MDIKFGAVLGRADRGENDMGTRIPVAVRDLTKIYGDVTAVDHISFTVEPSTTVALLGGNGAGKTTTIAMLLGLVIPSAGEVRVFGADMSQESRRCSAALEFPEPLCRPSDALDRKAEPLCLCWSLRRRECR